jgi:hypothetical protein
MTGSRGEADFVVRRAVRSALRVEAEFATEAEAHRYVLSSIRAESLSPRGVSPSGSVLELLHEGKADAAAARRVLQRLSRSQRRTIERLLAGRPPASLDRIARDEGISSSAVAQRVESGLRQIAAGFRKGPPPAFERGPHPGLEALLDYVGGSLTGERAVDVAAHCRICSSCGDELGTMMLLKTSWGESLRVPLVSRTSRRMLGVALVAAAIAAGGWVYDRMMPNPWKEHATSETVPRWFYDFFDRGPGSWSSGDSARGLALLVEGRYAEAIEELEPLVESHPEDTEASTYLGVARFLSGDASRSTVRLLEQGTSSFRAGRLARWYLANAWLVRGDVDRAVEELEELAATGDWFGRSAKALLKKLEEAKRAPDRPAGTVAGR